jgi:hypothetical protein
MGLVDKTNPIATRETVIRAAVIGAAVGVAGYRLTCYSNPE